jgi:hypothetical protein
MAIERRLVRDIVCAYTRTELPTAWLQVHRRFEHAFKRAGLRVRVRLYPIEELPERYDLLVVAPELADEAARIAPGVRVVRATRQDAATVAAELVKEIEAGTTLYAERAKPGEPIVVTHRGPEIL